MEKRKSQQKLQQFNDRKCSCCCGIKSTTMHLGMARFGFFFCHITLFSGIAVILHLCFIEISKMALRFLHRFVMGARVGLRLQRWMERRILGS